VAVVLELVQFSCTLDAEDGENVGSSVNVFPTCNPTLSAIAVIGVVTVTVVVAVFAPSAEVAVITVVPFDLPVTRPFATVATEGFVDDQLIDLFAALVGLNCAVSVVFWPIFNNMEEGRDIDCKAIGKTVRVKDDCIVFEV